MKCEDPRALLRERSRGGNSPKARAARGGDNRSVKLVAKDERRESERTHQRHTGINITVRVVWAFRVCWRTLASHHAV